MGKPRGGAPSGRVSSGAPTAMESDGGAAGPASAAAHDTHTSSDYYFDSYAHFGAPRAAWGPLRRELRAAAAGGPAAAAHCRARAQASTRRC